MQQIKNKKFYALKYNHKATHAQSQQTASESPVNPDLNNNTTDANIVRKGSNTDVNHTRKAALRKNSRTNVFFSANEKQNTSNNETIHLRERVEELEQQVKSQAQKQSTIPSTDNTEIHIQKNVNTAQNLDKGPTPNINEMLKFIGSTMQTLSAFT